MNKETLTQPSSSQQKENLGARSDDNFKMPKRLRNPFSDLSDNIKPDVTINRKYATNLQTKLNVFTSETKFHSRSESGKEKVVNVVQNSNNVTEGASKKATTTQTVDEVFVEGEQHFINYVSKEQQECFKTMKLQELASKIVKPLPVVRVSLDNVKVEEGAARKPAQKTTLVQRRGNRKSRLVSEDLYNDCLYPPEYFSDNYKYMLRSENAFVYRRSILKQRIDENFRMLIINWLIYLQQILQLSENTLFAAVRIFDGFIVKSDTEVATSQYGLIAVTSLWIANKLKDSCSIPVSKLFSLCDGKLSKNEISSMEISILKTLTFNVNYPEPLTFLYYHLKKENLVESRKIRLEAMFLLELFTMLLEFSSSAPSILAASALHIVITTNKLECETFLSYVNSTIIKRGHFELFSKQMYYYAQKLLECKGFKNEVVAKYSMEDRLGTSYFNSI